jgi:hypothetical protein
MTQLPPPIATRLANYPDRRTVPALESLYRDAVARDEREERRLARLNVAHWQDDEKSEA